MNTTKYIVRATTENEIVMLMCDTKTALDMGVRWDANSIVKIADTDIAEWEVHYAISKYDWQKVDDLIMDADVPTGGMVVLCDGVREPQYGFVCGNGHFWYRVELPIDIREALLPPKEFGIDFNMNDETRWMQWFNTMKEMKKFVINGFYNTYGAERKHYEDMLMQILNGEKILRYWND